MTPWDRLAELSVRAQTGGLSVAAWCVPATVLEWIIEDVRDLNPGAAIVYHGLPVVAGPGWGVLTDLGA